MGKLRCVPKTKSMDREIFDTLLTILREAQHAAGDNKVFWDLDPDERSGKAKKDFLYVARKEGIPLLVRQLRKSRSLAFEFTESTKERGRMSAATYKKRILSVLHAADNPLKKAEIIKVGELTPSVWNPRVRELIEDGSVNRKGRLSEAVYSIA